MVQQNRDYSAVVAESAAAIIDRLNDQLVEVTRVNQQVLVRGISELPGDAQSQQLLRDNVAAMLDNISKPGRYIETRQETDAQSAPRAPAPDSGVAGTVLVVAFASARRVALIVSSAAISASARRSGAVSKVSWSPSISISSGSCSRLDCVG
jgi:hypothetical protein